MIYDEKIGLLCIALLVTFSLSMANPHPVDAKKEDTAPPAKAIHLKTSLPIM
ncbi:hypothetical protein P7H12_00430 [Paenibacillus larvae]|nr:hypothetical protein [Paenibacillus larvae]MDT2262433.1 hypothetical protein [Paenibacillus larvae]